MSYDPGLFDGRYLIPGEDPEEFLALVQEHLQRYPNVGIEIEFYVSSLIHDAWELRRYHRGLRKFVEAARNREPNSQFPELNHPAVQMLHKHMGSLLSRYDQTVRWIQRLQKEQQREEARARKLGSFRQKAAKPAGPFLVAPPASKTKPN